MRAQKPIFTLLFAFILLLPGAAWTQYGIHMGLRPGFTAAQAYNPAYLAQSNFGSVAIGFRGDAWVNNSEASLKGIFAENGYITEETKDRILSQASGSGSLNAGYGLDLARVNFRAGELPLSVSITDRFHNTLGIGNPLTVGLFLKGNGPYAGETITDEGVFFKSYHTRELGIGTAIESGSLRFGGRLKFLQGVSFIDLTRLDYSVFTESDGTLIDLTADYELYRQLNNSPGIFDFQGFGVALDLGMTYELNEQFSIEASVLDAGATFWNAKRNAANASVQFEGISVNSLFQDSLPEVIEQQVDSLTGLLLPDSTLEKHTMLTPTVIRLGATYKLDEQSSLAGYIVYAPVKTGPYTMLPMLSVAYSRELTEGLVASANLYGGGPDLYGFGLALSYAHDFSESFGLQAIVGSDNLLGIALSPVGRGFNLHGGVGLSF